MKYLTKILLSSFSVILFIFLAASPVKAIYFRTGDTLTVASDKKIDETAVVTGQTITIDSDINGDVYCAGRDIVINGDVKGDVACVGQSIKINGVVDGNIRVLAQSIDVAGTINRNITIASQSLTLEPKSQVKGDIFFGAQNVSLGGLMGRDLAGAGETMAITGSLVRNALITSTDLSVIETAKVGGNLDYYVESNAVTNIDPKNVKGTITKHEIVTKQNTIDKEKIAQVSRYAMISTKVFGILAFALIGLVLVYLDRKNTEIRINRIQNQPLKSGLIGFAVLFLFPIAFIIMLITVVGIPLAIVVLFTYIVALMISSLYSSIVYGKLLIEKIFRGKSSLLSQMLAGVTLLGLITWVPVIGWFLGFVSLCLGLGAYTTSLVPEKQ